MVRRWLRWFRAPLFCGDVPPPYRDVAWHDDTSPDQLRIEAAILPLVRPTDVVLHVGVGSGRLGRRLPAARVDGITVAPGEPGARMDKHHALPEGPYDWVVDNNPSSFACCRRHFLGYLDAVAARLAPGGRFVTDVVGLAYAEPYAFGLSPRRFARLGRARGMEVVWLTDSVLAWRRPTRG
jgi:hypothetical protein